MSRASTATTAASALERALISRFVTLGRVNREFLLRSDNGLVFTSRRYTGLVRSYGLRQEFVTPHCPQQNHCSETIQHAARAIGDWIRFYITRRPPQALAMRTPADASRLAA